MRMSIIQNNFKIENKQADFILLKDDDTGDYFIARSMQDEIPIKDFLSFLQTICTKVCKLKYGEDILMRAKEFHDLNSQSADGKELANKNSYGEFLKHAEARFKEKWPRARVYPAVILKHNSEHMRQYNQFVKGKLPLNDNILVSSVLKSNSVAVFELNEDCNITLLHHYAADLSYKILRGKGTIGNLIEVNYGTVNLLLDCGRELGEEAQTETELEKQVLSKAYDGILISHYHLDHAGLVDKARSTVFMGKGCLDVLNAQLKYRGDEPLKNVKCFNANEEFSIQNGGFEVKIKPILVDHSAYDSYMFLITGGDKTLLYTGDFRSNGRKSFDGALKNLPSKVDYLICEATNMFSNKKNLTESEVERQATDLCSYYKHVFVFQAGTNIDRLVSFYKVSRKNGKAFLIDTYVAGITENLPNIPNVKTFKDVYCFWDFPRNFTKKDIKKHSMDWRLFKSSGRGLGSLNLGSPKDAEHGDLSNFTMLVRPSMLNYLKRVDEDKKVRFNHSIFESSVLIYSLWNGYKANEDVKNFLAEMEHLGVRVVDLHASGHADRQTIDRLKAKVNPTVIEYVHYTEDKNEEINLIK